jgi:anti-sigma B factor antagonist
MQFSISHAQRGAWTVVTVSGEVDMATGPALRDDVAGVLTAGSKRIVLDLSGVTFMDSSGLGALISIHRRARLLEAEVRLGAPSERVAEILRLTSLHRVFKVHSTLAGAADDDAVEARPGAS